MTAALCEAFHPDGSECDQPGTDFIDVACVHEHVFTGFLVCGGHFEAVEFDAMRCHPCAVGEAPHTCMLKVRAVFGAVRG